MQIDARVAGVGAAVIAAWRKAPLIAVILIGAGVTAAIRAEAINEHGAIYISVRSWRSACPAGISSGLVGGEQISSDRAKIGTRSSEINAGSLAQFVDDLAGW